MGEIREHKGREVVAFMRDHPDVPFSIEDVAKAVNWSQSSTNTALARLLKSCPESMDRIGRGVYRWNSVPKPVEIEKEKKEENVKPLEYLFEVLTIQDQISLCRDLNTGKLYRVSEFTLKGEL